MLARPGRIIDHSIQSPPPSNVFFNTDPPPRPLGIDFLIQTPPLERVTRAYTVEVQTASVFYAQSLILLAS